MPDPVTIDPEDPLNPGLDYGLLREEGIQRIQQLAGEIWTDYNESDPGVTTLEMLCYALTELSYRAELPIEDLLIDKPQGTIQPKRQALFIPKAIFPCNPLTQNDYRKLFVDQVPGVANAWLTCVDPDQANGVNGLYEISVYVPDPKKFRSDVDCRPNRVRQRVFTTYCAHRNLCEDLRDVRAFRDVRILDPLRTVVSADIAIDETQTPERILAGLLFAVGNFLAPQLRRRSLQDLLAAGRTPDEIFNGPLLKHGFIDDAQLQPKMNPVYVDQIISVMAQSPGVRGVNRTEVRVAEDDRVYRAHDRIEVADEDILELATGPIAINQLKLSRNGVLYKPNVLRVERELDRLWKAQRETYPLSAQYEEYFGFPQGEFRDVKQYYSVQNQFPNVYGISEFGLPEGATKPRRAQAKQFKGYLLVFEQLMADYFAQLANVNQLYSIEPAEQTYFGQSLAGSVPNVQPLLSREYERGLQRIIADQDPFVERRNRFLDFLLALYAEQLDASSVASSQQSNGGPDGSGKTLINAKQRLLKYLVESTRDRGRGFDYLATEAGPHGVDRNIAGMLIKSRIQLGMPVFASGCCADLLERLGLHLVTGSDTGQVLDGEQIARIEKDGRTVAPPAGGTKSSAPTVEQLARDLQLPTDRRLDEDWLSAAGDCKNFRILGEPGRELSVWCQQPDLHEWHWIGQLEGDLATIRQASEAVHTLNALVKSIHHCAQQQLYVVEHTLLRPRGKRPRGRTGNFDYSFTISAVLGRTRYTPVPAFTHQQQVVEVLRQNTPAHIAIDPYFLTCHEMCEFEILYKSWREALQSSDVHHINLTSDRLRRFLQGNRSPDDEPPQPSDPPRDEPVTLVAPLMDLPFNGDIENHSQIRLTTSARGSYSATYDAGIGGMSKRFDGPGVEIRVEGVSELPITDAFTLEFWIYPSKRRRAPAVVSIASLGDRLVIQLNTDAYSLDVTLRTETAETRLTGTIKPNQWHHVAIVYRGSQREICLFLGGKQVDSKQTITSFALRAKDPFRVGGLELGFTGRICQLHLYNAALATAVLLEHATQTSAR